MDALSSIHLTIRGGRVYEGTVRNRDRAIVTTSPAEAIAKLHAGQEVFLYLGGTNLQQVRDLDADRAVQP